MGCDISGGFVVSTDYDLPHSGVSCLIDLIRGKLMWELPGQEVGVTVWLQAEKLWNQFVSW